MIIDKFGGSKATGTGFNFKMPDVKDLSEGGEISYQPKFLVGHCLHAEIIKLFLKANGVKFYAG